MEKGRIRSITGHDSSGTIADGEGRLINFSNSSIVGRDRLGLRMGDLVWFERIGTHASSNAINIRKC
ncbi:MAG: hypothetical protein A2Z88_02495 [Omnitrophica WOR_2 bacterium GWA2_47_8]|nr:MAG: hypothetical protein A2Z88_02495 [Omnitrophica WOR_2 bacterium GWA2_47_8]